MSEREKETDRYRFLSFLHQLTGHIINSRNMIGIYPVPHPKSVS